jgi:hypothetical protein
VDKRFWTTLRATVSLALADAAWLSKAMCLPLLVALQGLTALALYVAPPLTRSDRIQVMRDQEELALLLLMVLSVVAWILARHHDVTIYTRRFDRSGHVLVAEVTALLLALATSASAWVVSSSVVAYGLAQIGVCRVAALPLSIAALSTLAAIAPLVALAPGLARIRAGLPFFACLLAACIAGLLGFFGRSFPLRADTVFELRGASKSWWSDALACAGCLLVSSGIAGWRKPDPTCG